MRSHLDPEVPQFPRLGRELSLVALGQATAAIGAIVGVRLLTHVLPPSGYGELALGITAATLVQQTVLLPLSGAAFRFFAPAREAGELRPYLAGVRALFLRASAFLIVLIGTLTLAFWAAGQTRWLGLIVVSFAFALLSGYSAAIDAMQNAARHRTVVAWHDGLAPWLRFLMAVGLIHVVGSFSGVAMSGYALASVVLLGSQWWFFRRRILVLNTSPGAGAPVAFDAWTRQMYAYAWPFAAWGLFSWAHVASQRWALQAFATTSAVGLYAVLYQVGYYPMTFLSGLLSQLVAPLLFSRAGDASDPVRLEDARRLNTLAVIAVLVLTGLATALANWFHPRIFASLVAREYREVSPLLPWMVLAGGLYAAGQAAALSRLIDTRTRSLIVPIGASALLGIVLSVVGARWLGVTGVVRANVASSLVYFLWVSVRGKWSSRILELRLIHQQTNG